MPELSPIDRQRFLELTSALWSGLHGARIFVTGGTGFVGSWLLESFVWANDAFDLNARLVVLTRNPASFAAKCGRLASHPAIAFHAGDVRTFSSPGGFFRYLIHAATDAHPAADSPVDTLATIADGTQRTLAFARESGVESYLLVSSGAVYGPQPAEMSHIPEDYGGAPDSTRAASAYGGGKRMAELLCAAYTDQFGLDCKMARCFAFAGPYLPPESPFAMASFLRDAVLGRPITVNGDGTPVRSYLYAMDLAVWLWTILLRGAPGRAYNVGSEHALTVGQLAEEISRLVSPDVPIRVSRAPVPGSRPARYVPSTRLAREELSLQEFTDLNQAIIRTADWYRQTLAVGRQ